MQVRGSIRGQGPVENGDKEMGRREQQSLEAQRDTITSVNTSIRMWRSLVIPKGRKKVRGEGREREAFGGRK